MGGSGGHRLRVGESPRQQSPTSPDDAFTSSHFGYDDLMLVRNSDREPLWWSSTRDNPHSPHRSSMLPTDVTLEPGGDLVAHDENHAPLWSTGTAGSGAARPAGT